MKPILTVEENDFTEIKDRIQNITVGVMNLTYNYNDGCKYRLRSLTPAFSDIPYNQSYVDSLLQLIGYLYNYYEVDQKHFELLNYALGNLERLHEEQIKSLPSSKHDELTKFSAYLNKGALIFEIASDRMEIPDEPESGKQQGALYRQTYITLSQEYSKKADELLGIKQGKTQAAKMLALCEKTLADPSQCPFAESFLSLVIKYREKCAREVEAQVTKKLSAQYAAAAVVETETAPLLAATSSIPRSGSDGLLTKAKDAVISLASFFRKAPEKDESAHRAARAASEPVIEIDSEKIVSEPHRRKNS